MNYSSSQVEFSLSAVERAAEGRKFLFLQGPASPFFWRLGGALRARAFEVRKINLCLGDRLFWPGSAHSYRGPFAKWRDFLGRYLARERISDIVLFGDCRDYHRVAVECAKASGIAVHVFEEGYIRPNWITLENGGANGFSSFPRDPGAIIQRAAGLPPVTDRPVGGGMPRRVAWDIIYNLASVFGRPLYWGYRRHRPRHVFWEYSAWLRRLTREANAQRFAQSEVRRLLTHPGGFYLIPLQLDSDFQVREHSDFDDNGQFLRMVVASFVKCAPPDSHLAVKVHPLDNGLIDRSRQVKAIASDFGVSDRVTCIDGGHLPTLLDGAHGVILINSTVGTQSLHQNRPTVALGNAVYDIPGLTFQGPLDEFWHSVTGPDAVLYQAFYRLIVRDTQISGSFFSAAGLQTAIAGAADRLSRPRAGQPPGAVRVSGAGGAPAPGPSGSTRSAARAASAPEARPPARPA